MRRYPWLAKGHRFVCDTCHRSNIFLDCCRFNQKGKCIDECWRCEGCHRPERRCLCPRSSADREQRTSTP